MLLGRTQHPNFQPRPFQVNKLQFILIDDIQSMVKYQSVQKQILVPEVNQQI